MAAGAESRLIDDGRRLHLHHGPIDLIIEAVTSHPTPFYEAATDRFRTVLDELVGELPLLREQTRISTRFAGSVAQRMQAATARFLPTFVTPMAAVAGAVADDMLASMIIGKPMPKIYVNNGGDCAFYLPTGGVFRLSVAGNAPATIEIRHHQPVRGVATSGWGGRSFSLGIADSVTVLAPCSAVADAAATLIANAVDLPDHPAIQRQAAVQLSPDSDLGARLVTTGVGTLSTAAIDSALGSGVERAEEFLQAGHIAAALIMLKDEVRTVGQSSLISN